MLSLLRQRNTSVFRRSRGVVSRYQSAIPVVSTGEKEDGYHEAVWKWLSGQTRLQQLGLLRGLQRQDVYVASAPGRVDVMGGFADFNGSHVLQYPTSERTVAVAMIHRGSCIGTDKVPILRLVSLQVPSLGVITNYPSNPSMTMATLQRPTDQEISLPMSLLQSPVTGNVTDSAQALWDGLREAVVNGTRGEADNWPYYVTGVVHAMMQMKKRSSTTLTPSSSLQPTLGVVPGDEITVITISDLPWNAGLASSASVETAVALAIGHALHIPSAELNPKAVALLCQAVEHNILGAKCGIMDQLAVAHPFHYRMDEPALIDINCRLPLTTAPWSSVPLGSHLEVISIDSGVRRSVAGSSHYAIARVASSVGKQIINNSLPPGVAYNSLCDIPYTQTASMRVCLPETMTGAQVIEEYGSILSDETIQEVANLAQTTSLNGAMQGGLDPPGTAVEPPLFPIRHATVHPIEENERVRQFKNILLASTVDRRNRTHGRPAEHLSQMGAMMRQSHDSYAHCGLDHENTNLLVDLMYATGCSGGRASTQRRGYSGGGGNGGGSKGASAVVGAKSSGAGGGGVVVAFLNNAFSPRVQDLQLCEVQEKYSRWSGGKSCVVRSGSLASATFHGNFHVGGGTTTKRPYSTFATNDHSAGSVAEGHRTSSGALPPAANASKKKLPHVLFVNHGFPPEFNGGSEVYAQTLALQVLKSGAFTCDVFAREKTSKQAAQPGGETTLLNLLVKLNSRNSVSYIVKRSCPCEKMNLQRAADLGDLERVQLLLGQGVDKDEAGHDGYTALFNAAYAGHLAIVQCLVEQGSNKEKASNYGSTPLNIASLYGHLEVLRYLLEQGADRDRANKVGCTPLHNAAAQGHLETAMLLMSYGADLNARDNYGNLPIDLARSEGIKQAIRDEPRRRMDHGHKRATEQDRHPNAATSASAQQENEEEEEKEEQSNKRPRLDEGGAEAEVTKVAEEDEDSEPSSDEEEDY